MEGCNQNQNLIKSLLSHYIELLKQGEIHLLRESFYYNFEEIALHFPNSENPRRRAMIFVLRTIYQKTNKETTKRFHEVLRSEEIFNIDLDKILSIFPNYKECEKLQNMKNESWIPLNEVES